MRGLPSDRLMIDGALANVDRFVTDELSISNIDRTDFISGMIVCDRLKLAETSVELEMPSEDCLFGSIDDNDCCNNIGGRRDC